MGYVGPFDSLTIPDRSAPVDELDKALEPKLRVRSTTASEGATMEHNGLYLAVYSDQCSTVLGVVLTDFPTWESKALARVEPSTMHHPMFTLCKYREVLAATLMLRIAQYSLCPCLV